MNRKDIIIAPLPEYALLDSGEGRKLERFSGIMLDRPEPQALWTKKEKTAWFDAQAQFVWADKGERWKQSADMPDTWTWSYGGIVLELSCGGFKHIGVFPEHAPQWDFLINLGKKNPGLRMLNLFGYSGAASIAAAQGGMKVTHVDASKTTIGVVKRNAEASGLPADTLRLVCEDAQKYTKRLIAREETFDVIVLDPPAFGRGPKGEVWKIEESLLGLLSLLPKILSTTPKLVLLNGYAAGYSATTFGELLREVLPLGAIEYGEVGIREQSSDRILTTSIYAKWEPIGVLQ